MKISTSRFLMAATIAAGIFAVAVTHRSDDSGVPESFEASSVSFRSLDQLTGKNLVGQNPTDSHLETATAPVFETESEIEPSIRIAQRPPEFELPSLAADPISDEELQFEDSSFDIESVNSTDETEVQSYSYLLDESAGSHSDQVAIKAHELESPVVSDTTTTVRDLTDSKWQANERTSKWKTNPFIGKQQNDTSSPEPKKQLELPALDFSSTTAAPIERVIEATTPAVDTDNQIAVTSGILPRERFVDQIPASAQSNIQSTPQYEAPIVLGMSEAAAQKAAHHIEYGKSLARRNATQLATQEFFSALRVLAQANDTRIGNDSYTSALRSGIIALKEAQDFLIGDPQSNMGVKVGSVIEAHETQLIGLTEARSLNTTDAAKKYLLYAGQQFGFCGGQNVIAAEALFCLGKLNSISAQADPNPESSDLTKAQVFHRASLEADPQNFRSANELGVLLARSGELNEAEQLLKRSLITRPIPQAWGNLAKIHQRKGTVRDLDLAQKAQAEYQMAMTSEAFGMPVNTIQWLEPQEFIARSPAQNPEMKMATQTTANQNAVIPVSNLETGSSDGEKTSIADRIKSVLPGSLRR